MKTNTTENQISEDTTDAYVNVMIEDESGFDTFKIKKALYFATLAEHLRQISARLAPIKIVA